jgi:hypothetical protein
MTIMKLHRAPDDPVIPEGIPIPGPRPGRSDHPPVSEPDDMPLPPAKEPPAPARREQVAAVNERMRVVRQAVQVPAVSGPRPAA